MHQTCKHRLRVGILTSGVVWTPGGSFGVMYMYANYLVRYGHDVWVVYPVEKPSLTTPRSWLRVVREISIPLSHTSAWFPLDPRVRKKRVFTRGQIPDRDVWVGMLPSPTVIRLLKTLNRPAVVFVQSFKETLRIKDFPWPVIAVSRVLYERVRDMGKKDVIYLPNGVDIQHFFPRVDVQDRPYHLCMGVVAKPAKDLDTGLRVLSSVYSTKPGIRILLFGPHLRPPKAPFPFSYEHRIPFQKMPDLYNSCKIFLSTSREEGFGLPVLEAMACGCAVVTTDSLGVRDMVIPGKNALLHPPGDAEGLTKSILQLLSSPERMRSLALAGVRTARRFSWDRSARRLEEILCIPSRREG